MRYAEIRRGKVVKIYNCDFDFKTFTSKMQEGLTFLDVTNAECKLGWEVEYDSNLIPKLIKPEECLTGKAMWSDSIENKLYQIDKVELFEFIVQMHERIKSLENKFKEAK